ARYTGRSRAVFRKFAAIENQNLWVGFRQPLCTGGNFSRNSGKGNIVIPVIKKRSLYALSIFLLPTVFAGGLAFGQKNSNTQVGMLNCTAQGGVGLILGSRKKINCTFNRSNGSKEGYVGTITKVGIDIGVTKKSIVSWAVFAPSVMEDAGALAGNYAGVSAQVTVVGGVGAQALVGGRNAITLQPFSVGVQKGLNVAGGIASVRLEPVAR
ncbi:MAG: DUF992 domain-containing protein, partial [Rhizobiaceae bacterium]